MSTGENEQALRKIMDMTRLGSILLLLLHFYFYCYTAFKDLGLRFSLTDHILRNLVATGFFKAAYISKAWSMGLLLISLLGTRGKKQPEYTIKSVFVLGTLGMVLYWISHVLLQFDSDARFLVISYIIICSTGFCLCLAAGTRISRILQISVTQDVFNIINETFPQEEKLHSNEYSVNFRAQYSLKSSVRRSWINIINPFRGTLVTGSPGAGKSWFIILPLIRQQIQKGYAMFIYDFKYDDLSKAAYNWLLQYQKSYDSQPSFYAINFDNLATSHRCNPLDPDAMIDITDATESARSILLGLNREWIKKQGDFFVESPINFVTAIIWFLRKHEDGMYCTLPHVIELMQVDYDKLFPVLNTQPEIEVLVNPFISAYQNDAMEQLEGQIASAKIGMARLASPSLYWVLSGNDFTLDINSPSNPKIVCIGNNPEKQTIYGAVLSLYVSRLVKIVNKKGRQKSSLVFDEFPTIFFNNMDSLIATARSNKVATLLAMQDFSQLKKDYGRDQAEVITNICGNIISGQVVGDTAKSLSERFGKIVQEKRSMNVNRMDTSSSTSWQLDQAIPPSRIATLSSGQFVGLVADNPDDRIKLKMFHADIQQDTNALNLEMKTFKDIPQVYDITTQEIQDNYYQIKFDIQTMVEKVIAKLLLQKKQKIQSTLGNDP